MPKVHIPRKSVSIDMTPMVDMAFLLVTFFMLTASFHPDEPVKIQNPKSISKYKVPTANKTTIEVSDSGKVYFNFDGKFNRQNMLLNIGRQFNINFTQDETNTFGVQGTMGIPINELKKYLDTDVNDRKNYPQKWIPVDSLNNELKYWLIFSVAANNKSKIIIKADNMAQYGVVKKVIATLQSRKINQFALITNEIPNPLEKNNGGLKL
jgi:biopolymer transport protein ExbD